LVASFSLVVPDLAFAEIGNALWRRIRNGDISIEKAQDLVPVLSLSIFEVRATQPFISRALIVAAALNHPIYDCIYLALAEHLGIPFVTADQRFLQAIRRNPVHEVQVSALADFS
jgi:predicted nucleic acid-binding protein